VTTGGTVGVVGEGIGGHQRDAMSSTSCADPAEDRSEPRPIGMSMSSAQPVQQ
jgi:hypothetical protein